MLVARALQNSEVLFVDRAGKFTEYDVGEEEEDFKERLELVKIRSAELANIRYVNKLVKIDSQEGRQGQGGGDYCHQGGGAGEETAYCGNEAAD